MMYSSQSDYNAHNINKLIDTETLTTRKRRERRENPLQEQIFISTYELLKLEQEAEMLREQLKTLSRELQHERQLVEEYHQELLYTNAEMSLLNIELQNAYSSEKLGIDEAKRLAQIILSKRRCTSESLAELLSTKLLSFGLP